MIQAYLRPDGGKGIRNTVAVVYLVECARHVAQEIALPFRHRGAHVIGFPAAFRTNTPTACSGGSAPIPTSARRCC